MVKVEAALRKVKRNYDRLIPARAILQIGSALNHRFRHRKLGPVETVYLFLVQVLHGNTACNGLRHLAGMACSASAYCKARARLPLERFRILLTWVAQSLRDLTDTAAGWHGHRVFHVDGSSFSMDDTDSLQAAFGQSGEQQPGCGFPTAHLLAMFDAATGVILDVLASPLRTHEMSQVREVRYRIETPGYRTRQVTLVTTLLDGERYPAEDLAELYRCRWQIEVNLRRIKQTMGMDVLRCQSPEGVRKEMLMFALVYNLVCCVIFEAADRQGVPPDRISFVDALRWLRSWRPGRELIDLIVNPRRPGRYEPRVVKRRPKQYSLMTEPRDTLRKRLVAKEVPC